MTINDLVMNQTSLTNNGLDGFRIPTSMASMDGLLITASHLDNNSFAGWETYTAVTAGPLNNVMVSDTSFNDNVNKGMYIERLSNAVHFGWIKLIKRKFVEEHGLERGPLIQMSSKLWNVTFV